jgi:serine/threonine protein kinase
MPTSPTPPGVKRDPSPPAAFHAFVQTVLRSGLLRREELHAAMAALPPDRLNDPQALADRLVAEAKLTGFQARKLLEGTSLGLVLGAFHVLAPIGKGGMGTVYMARDTRNQQLVALKVLPPKRARTEERLLARFQREMQLSQRVAHSNLTQTLEVGVHHGVYYIAMEYIPGQTLYRLVNEQGPLTVPRAARLFAQVASGLEHAHGQGLIHRDLKPSNLMIMPNEQAKVLDLGLALVQNEVSSDRTITGGQGYIVGTMDYIAPEQAEDPTRVDPRSDIYSLGCTLYFALTGQPPFPGGTSMQKIMRHRTEEPVPVTDHNPTVPVAFWGLVRRMMDKRPERRPGSASAVRAELRKWAPVEAPPVIDLKGEHEYEQALAAVALKQASPEQFWEAVVTVSRPADSASIPGPAPAAEPGTLPFWLDYLLPVGAGSVLLVLAWWIALNYLLR